MSYDIRLLDPVTKEAILFDDLLLVKKGTYCFGASSAYVNIPESIMDYPWIYYLNGLTGANSIQILEAEMDQLEDGKSIDDNVKWYLLQLLVIAKMRPDGIWEVVINDQTESTNL